MSKPWRWPSQSREEATPGPLEASFKGVRGLEVYMRGSGVKNPGGQAAGKIERGE